MRWEERKKGVFRERMVPTSGRLTAWVLSAKCLDQGEGNVNRFCSLSRWHCPELWQWEVEGRRRGEEEKKVSGESGSRE